MLRLILLITILTSVSIKPIIAQEDKNIFIVENVEVKTKGKSPSSARAVAVNNARRDAFLILLTRLELNLSIADNISDEEISDMIRSEQVINEKIAGNNYSASFNITFAKNFVDHILSQKTNQKGSALENKDKEIYLAIPVLFEKNEYLIWEDENKWRSVLKNFIKQKKTSKKIIIPEPSFDNIESINKENILKIDYNQIEQMIEQNKASSAYILFLDFNNDENKALVKVLHLRKLQKNQFKLSFTNTNKLNYDDLISNVAQKTVEYLEESIIGKDKNFNSNLIRLGLNVDNISQWLNIKKIIESSNLVDEINIISISKNYVEISVNYTNSQKNIEENFAKIGIIITKKSDNFYTYNSTN